MADGWIPSVPYLEPGQLESGNERIDAAAEAAGRDPVDIRRLLNVSGSYSDGTPGPLAGNPSEWPSSSTDYAIEHGIGTFIAMADDPGAIEAFAAVGPAVRELVERERGGAGQSGSRCPRSRPSSLPSKRQPTS